MATESEEPLAHAERWEEWTADRRRRLDEVNREIRGWLREALAVHRCSGFQGCWCRPASAALGRAQDLQ